MEEGRSGAYLCLRTPRKPGLSLLTKWVIPTVTSLSGWKPVSEIATLGAWGKSGLSMVVELLLWLLFKVVFSVFGDIDGEVAITRCWSLLMGGRGRGRGREVEEVLCLFNGGSMAVVGLAILGEALMEEFALIDILVRLFN